MNTKTHKDARACFASISELAANASNDLFDVTPGRVITPMRVLLDHADALLNGHAEAREHKNAGDRKRRARKKAPGKKRTAKNPRGGVKSIQTVNASPS